MCSEMSKKTWADSRVISWEHRDLSDIKSIQDVGAIKLSYVCSSSSGLFTALVKKLLVLSGQQMVQRQLIKMLWTKDWALNTKLTIFITHPTSQGQRTPHKRNWEGHEIQSREECCEMQYLGCDMTVLQLTAPVGTCTRPGQDQVSQNFT